VAAGHAPGGALYTLTSPDPKLPVAERRLGFKPCTYQVKTRFKSLPFKCNLHRYAQGALAGAGNVAADADIIARYGADVDDDDEE
jgi:hypothetical protein